MQIVLVGVVLATVTALQARPAAAGTVIGKLELPPAPERPPLKHKGFLDRVDNPLAPVRPVNAAPSLAVVLEGDDKPQNGGASVTWELAGESFARPVLAVPVGTEVVIKNTSKSARVIVATEDPKLIPAGPIQAGSPKSFRPTAPAILTLGDTAAPHLTAKLLIVDTKYVATVDDAGKFEIPDVAAGSYKLRVYYYYPQAGKDGWLDLKVDAVAVAAGKAKAEVATKIPAGYPIQGAAAPADQKGK